MAFFAGAKKFNQKIGVWDVSNVTYMSGVFSFATNFNQPLNSWDVAKVTDMRSMFFGSERRTSSFSNSGYPIELPLLKDKNPMKFNQDISSWNVSEVKHMDRMFSGAMSFSNHNLSSWNVLNVISHDNFSNEWGTGNTEPNWEEKE